MRAKKKPTVKKKNRSFRDILSVIFALVAICALFYPIVANTLVSNKTADIVTKFNEKTSTLDKNEITHLLTSAKEYNTYIYDMSQHIPYTKSKPNYNQMLNIDNSGMMGNVSIPQIKVENVPVYHGDSEETLAVGIGHIPQTSLPIGGNNTHTVLSAHSGRVNNTLFTNLDKLKIGDVFYVDTLNLKMKYKINKIKVVDPEDVSTLGIQKGKDIATLVTCYPTGVNSQRLLVTGERVPYTSKTAQEEIQRDKYGYDFWVLLGSLILAILAVLYLIYKYYEKRKNRSKNTEETR